MGRQHCFLLESNLHFMARETRVVNPRPTVDDAFNLMNISHEKLPHEGLSMFISAKGGG